MKISSSFLQIFLALAVLMGLAKPDPDPLQDYCVADTKSSLYLNGAPSQPSSSFVLSLHHFGTSQTGRHEGEPIRLHSPATGLFHRIRTLGPRRSPFVSRGVILVGFVDTSNRLFSQRLEPGDSFVFPRGLIHFLYNTDPRKPALAVSGLNSQNPGAQIASRAAFVSSPPIPDVVLEKAFQISP
ncbi:hypothetical protein V6N13_017532 [Hibiscus sabdariffa]